MNASNPIINQLQDLDQLLTLRTMELQSANERLKEEIAGRLQAQESLRHSEERFTKAFQASPVPLAVQSLLNEEFVDANDGFLRLTGYTRDKLIGRTARQLKIWDNPEDERAMLERLRLEMSLRDLPCRLRTKSARLLEVLLSVELIELDGKPFLLTVAKDITQQVRLEHQLRQAQKLEAVGQLAADVAHDFNNILSVVKGNASLVHANKPPDSPDRKPLQNICTAADQAAKLAGQLLTFCRQQNVELRPADLGDILATIADTLPRLLTSGIKLEAHAASDLPSVCTDAGMMDCLLMNLALNSRDAMPEGGQLSITAELVTFSAAEVSSHPQRRVGDFVRLSVSDTGAGIPPEILPHIFEPFFTTKSDSQSAGMGLATVYGIVKHHQGWLEVQSKVNHGTTFLIYLPVWAGDESGHAAHVAEPKEPAGSRETILVVDDEPDLRDLLSQVLETDGYQVLSAASSSEALDQWAKRHGDIQLLLTDIVMPDGLSGRKLADRLRSEDPRLRVIFTSGYTAGQAGTELANLEERHFLPKPYRPNTLLRVVRECLDHPPSADPAREAA
jgi:two-component system cell cycle sensor histidine kinase/response regulator CckA